MIVVTTPTGDIGRQVVQNLLDRDAPVRVVARDPARLAPHVRDRVDVVPGSHGDAAVINDACAGADAVFWLVPPDPTATSLDRYTEFTRPACDAFTGQRVARVVGVSAVGRDTPMAKEAGLVTASLAMDDLIASTGVAYRALTMPSFMDNVLRQVVPIRDQGVYSSPLSADLKLPTCATRDIAAVAARLLLDDTWTGHGEVPVLGPEDLSGDDMVAIMSEVLGRPVRYQRVPWDAFRSALIARGMSEAMAQGMYDMYRAKDWGLDNGDPRTPESSSPTTFRQWCEEILKPAVRG
jgi:uncharacterized protein YbjT (DUF2867 family)